MISVRAVSGVRLREAIKILLVIKREREREVLDVRMNLIHTKSFVV